MRRKPHARYSSKEKILVLLSSRTALIYITPIFPFWQEDFSIFIKIFFTPQNRQTAPFMKRRRAGPIPLYVVAGSAAATAVVSAVVHIAVSIIVLAAADPDQDDHDNDPPPVVFAPKRIRRTHKLFPPIKDFTSYYGGSSALVTRRQKFFPAVRPETAPAPLRLPAYSCKSLPPLYR